VFREKLEQIYYSFPIQLLILNIRKNQMLLLYWFILFGFVSGIIGRSMGIHYLFLDPEYLNEVTPWGFAIIGAAVGGVIMSFNITCFILDSFRFSFLSRVNRPLTKFSINNGIIPIAFVIFYIVHFVRFQLNYEYNTLEGLLLKMFGFLAGVVGVIYLFYLYFRFTNKDVFYVWAKDVDNKLRRTQINRVNVMIKLNTARSTTIRVDNYVNTDLQIKPVDNYYSYDKELVMRVFDYYQLNAVIIEVLILASIFIFGFFREIPIFQIPAAASGILLMNIFIMVTGALSHWLRRWSITIVIAVFFVFNNLVKYDLISSRNEAYGINYNTKKTEYSLKTLYELSSKENYIADKKKTIDVLNHWRNKFPASEKPKLIFICASGGGQRAALWTMTTLQSVNRKLNGSLLSHTALITGASGGLVGAGYFRELYLQSQLTDTVDLYNKKYLDNISKDLLNPVILSMVISNPMMSFQKFSYHGYDYIKDRGYAFEQQLNQNTNFVLEKPISHYKFYEESAQIPMMILAPTVINDGRRLYISPLPVSYMNSAFEGENYLLKHKVKGIEFSRFFAEQDGAHLRFTSALRMSATFPYVTPNIMLPSEPAMEIMDAGLSDNFGVVDAVRFLYVFKDWVKENTGGVVFVMIRDTEKEKEVKVSTRRSFVQEFFTPIGSLYKNWDNLQDFNNDNIVEYAQSWLGAEVDQVEFEYKVETEQKKLEEPSKLEKIKGNGTEDKASLSWRLTTREKESIKNSINASHNIQSINKLRSLLNNNRVE
jgi:hypothetical protein